HRDEARGPSFGRFSADDDIFFRVPKDRFIGSEQFDQIINPTKEPRLALSRGSRLSILDFPQCYDTSDRSLLNSMADKLHLPGEDEATFGDEHSARVLALPGRGVFRTGILLRVLVKEPAESPKSGPSEDRFTLFASFPYFGKFSAGIQWDAESESVGLLDFRRLGADVHDGGAVENEVERGGISDILVHQVRYMIFDNYTMATFRSKEDIAKDKAPLHRFQERIGAFRAMIHMIANCTDLELWTLGKLQALLCKIEEDIDQMILDAKLYEDNQGIQRIPADEPQMPPPGVDLTQEELQKWNEDQERARFKNVQKRKQKRVLGLLTSLNRLSAGLFAAISVAERQIAVLQDLHSVFLTSYRTKSKDHDRYSLWQNPFHKNIAWIPILSQNQGQIWPKTLDTIDDVVRERKSFTRKVKELVEIMDIRRNILFGFLKSDQAIAAPTERTVQEATEATKRTEDSIKDAKAAFALQ
ncbi:unnamed protein product, partial [Tuber aestivum]